jgi:hypothetical protein
VEGEGDGNEGREVFIPVTVGSRAVSVVAGYMVNGADM